jgi:5-methylcytosine-specific restriction endonuclease McrA
MSKKTLLLDATYQVLSFIPERKLFKLLFKDKVEVISEWDDDITWVSGRIKHPATVRLKNHVKRNYFNSNFSRKALVKRDRSSCQYCGRKLSASQITVDHVLPRAQGGITSFTNCVVSCQICNGKKADKTPEQAKMVLLKRPTHPSFSAQHYLSDPQNAWHENWDDYLSHS